MMLWIVRTALLFGIFAIVFAVLWVINVTIERRRLQVLAEDTVTQTPEFLAGRLSRADVAERVNAEVEKHMAAYKARMRVRLGLGVFGLPVAFAFLLVWLAEFD